MVIERKRVNDRLGSGVWNFDALIEGGFIKNSINLLIGDTGSGKSIFAVQFLIEGIKRGEGVFYIGLEEKKSEFYRNMLKLNINLDDLEKKGFFHFLEYSPEKIKTMLEEGGGAIENIVRTKNIKRLVIDSITSFEMLFEKENEKRRAILNLFDFIRKWNCTAILVYEGNPYLENKVVPRAIEYESDSVILLYFIREEQDRMRFIEVLKMRGVNHSLKLYPFFIGDNGVVVGKRRG